MVEVFNFILGGLGSLFDLLLTHDIFPGVSFMAFFVALTVLSLVISAIFVLFGSRGDEK